MDLLSNEQINIVKARLLQGMPDFIEDDENAEYTSDEVEQCDSILEEFLMNASKPDNKKKFIQEV